MAGIDEAGTEPADTVDGEIQPVGCRRAGDMHVRGGIEIVIGHVDVLATDPRSRTDEQPGLILVVQPIKVVRRLGCADRRKIPECGGCRVAGGGTVDIGRPKSEERPRQTVERRAEIHRLITGAARHAAYPWGRVDRKLLGPSATAVSREPKRRRGTPGTGKGGDHNLVSVPWIDGDTGFAIIKGVGEPQIGIGVVYHRVDDGKG